MFNNRDIGILGAGALLGQLIWTPPRSDQLQNLLAKFRWIGLMRFRHFFGLLFTSLPLSTLPGQLQRFEAQQVLIQLEALAHNVLVWSRQWLAPRCPKIARLGIKRLVRDVFQMDGFLIFDQAVDLLQVVLNRSDPLAMELSTGLAALLAQEQVAVSLGET